MKFKLYQINKIAFAALVLILIFTVRNLYFQSDNINGLENIDVKKSSSQLREYFGLKIESKTELGQTNIKLSDKPVDIGFQNSIPKVLDIHPDKNDNLNAKLSFSYAGIDLQGQNEEDLILYSSIDDGKTWEGHYDTDLDLRRKMLVLNDLSHFSKWTAAPRKGNKNGTKREILNYILGENNNSRDTHNSYNAVAPPPPAGCPDIQAIDLRGVPNFAQTDDLAVCGQADTLAILVFTDEPGTISGMKMTVNMEPGMEYAGFELTHYGGTTTITNVSDSPNHPSFLLDGVTGGDIFIAYIGVKATCAIDLSNNYNVDLGFDFVYTDTLGNMNNCSSAFNIDEEYNNSLSVPVLNIRSVSPADATITSIGGPFCQTIQFSQDGLSTYLDSVNFGIKGIIDGGDVNINSLNVNGTAATYIYDPLDTTYHVAIDNSYFINNGVPSPADNKFDTDETIDVEVCYSIGDCPNGQVDFPISYLAYYGCGGDICQITNKDSYVLVRPTGAIMPTATVDLVSDAEVCGNAAELQLTITNPNVNNNQFVINELKVGFNTCEKSSLGISEVSIGSTVLDPSSYAWDGPDILIRFDSLTMDPDAAGGLEDYDNDNYFDDLPGGETLVLSVFLEMECQADPGAACAFVDCGFTQFFVEGGINCGNHFKTFPPVNGGDLKYSPASDTTNLKADSTNLVGTTWQYNFGNYGAAPYGLSTRLVEYCYTFEAENVTPCVSTPNVYFQLTFNADSLVTADIDYVPGTAMFNDGSGYVAVPDANVSTSYPDFGTKVIKMDAGSPASGIEICYKMEVGLDDPSCAPRQYFVGNFRVIEECPDCNGGCEIVKSCRQELFSGDPYDTGCLCMFEQVERSFTRLNMGYTDKSLTTKVDRATVLANNPNDLTRFMPCDTMIGEEKYVIHDMAFFEDAAWWSWGKWAAMSNSSIDEGKNELSFDGQNSRLLEFSIIKNGTTVKIPIDLSSVPSCVADTLKTGSYSYRPIHSYFGESSAFGSYNEVYLPGRSQQNGEDAGCMRYDSYDGRDNHYIGFTLYNSDYLVGCRGYNTQYPDEGSCLSDFLAQYNVEATDTFYFKWTVPIVKNPHFEALLKQGRYTEADRQNNLKIRYSSSVYKVNTFNAPTCYSYWQGMCGEQPIVETVCPGDLTVKSELDIDDCGGDAKHIFTFDATIPNGWFSEEYRPLMDLGDVQVPVFSPMAYCGGAELVDIQGNIITMLPDTAINGSCTPLAGDIVCAVSSGDHQDLIFNFEDAGSNPFVVGKGLIQDSVVLTYDLCMLCPDVAPIVNYQVLTDWSLICGPPTTCRWNNYTYKGPLPDQNWTTIVPYRYAIINPDGTPFSGNWYQTLFGEYGTHTGQDTSIDVIVNDNRLGRTGLTANNISGTNLLASDMPGTSIEYVEMEVCAAPPAPAGGLIGINNLQGSIRVPSSVLLAQVLDDNGDPMVFTLVSSDAEGYSTYSVQLPDLNEGECTTIQVGTTLLFCPEAPAPPPEICANFSSNCADPAFQDAIAGVSSQGQSCGGVEICYAYIFGEAGLQTEWFLPAPLDPDPELCDTIEFAYKIKNVKTLTLLNLSTMVEIPNGMEVVSGSWMTSYPGKNTFVWTPIPDPDVVSGNQYAYSDDQLWNTDIHANGLKGVGAMADSNFVAIKFKTVTICDEFLSGSIMRTETTASDPCGPEPLTTGVVQSPQIIIQNADPADYAQLLTFADPEEAYCGASVNQFGVTALNISDNSTSDSVTVCLTIPPELTYQSNSIAFTNPTFTPSMIFETAIGNDLEVCFNAPSLSPGQKFSFTFDAVQDPNAGCGNIELGIDIKSFIPGINCVQTGMPCGVNVQNNISPILNVKLGPPLKTEKIVVTKTCQAITDPVNMCYEIDLSNPGPSYAGNIHVGFYEDLTGNGVLDAIDPEIIGADHAVSVNAGDTTTITMCLDVPALKSCPVLIGQTYETGCACDMADQLITDIIPDYFEELGEEMSLCPGDDLTFDVCASTDASAFALIPASAGTVSLNAGVVTVSLNPGAGDPGPVVLELTETTGSCNDVFRINLYQPNSIDFGPYTALSICDPGCTRLLLDLPDALLGGTILWTPSTYLDDPTSASPLICDPAGDIDYTVTVTLPGGCSSSAIFPVLAGSSCCSSDIPVVETICNDNGTPGDPTDDTYTYTILATGMSPLSSYSIGGSDNQVNLQYDMVNGPFGPFAIISGGLVLNITDDNIPTCVQQVIVPAPAPCSYCPPPVCLPVTITVN